MTHTTAGPTVPALRAAVRATYVAFIGSGFAFASWASRIPQVRDQLHLSAANLGLVLLAIAVGSIVALPLAGAIVQRITSRRTVGLMAVLLGAGLLTVALGYLLGVVPVVLGLLVLGFANGAWDVAMNVQGATVERHLGRAIMPRFHAGFSVGTVAGAAIVALCDRATMYDGSEMQGWQAQRAAQLLDHPPMVLIFSAGTRGQMGGDMK